MTKTEMVNRMIVLGCIKEEDRKYYMRKTADRLLNVYVFLVPKRLEYLAKVRDC